MRLNKGGEATTIHSSELYIMAESCRRIVPAASPRPRLAPASAFPPRGRNHPRAGAGNGPGFGCPGRDRTGTPVEGNAARSWGGEVGRCQPVRSRHRKFSRRPKMVTKSAPPRRSPTWSPMATGSSTSQSARRLDETADLATRLHHCTVTRLLSWGSGTRCQISLPLRQTSRTR